MARNRKVRGPSVGRGKHLKPPTPPAKGSTQHLRPIFSLEHLDREYCLSRCEQDEKAAFADTLHRLSRLTWQQIVNAPRHGTGCEKISRDSIAGSVPSVITDDVNIIALRFQGKKAMVGFRDDQVFYVIWLDRNFTLYRHG